LAGENATGGNPWASTEQVYIGADPGCGVRGQWVGVIDEITVFNVTLSDADVKGLSSGGVEGLNAVESDNKLTNTWGQIKTAF